MRRRKRAEHERARILTDDEIRAVWDAAGDSSYGRMVRFALLTAQRREKMAAMEWSDLHGDVWTIRTEKREKGNPGKLVLPKAALSLLVEPVDGLVFPGRYGQKISGWSKLKRLLDKRAGVNDWSFHDLRRTARSLMSRAGVRPEIAERVLGHSLHGVERVYDRHEYTDEKAVALAKLAGLIKLIIKPPVGNVVALKHKSA